MSVQALTQAIAIRGVTSSEKLLLMVLSNYANEKMQCWPSHRRLAEDACLSERTILTLMRGLEDRKIISRIQRRRDDGSRGTDVITLNLGGEATSPRGEHIAPSGEIDRKGVGKLLRDGGEVASPLTTFEPSSEPSVDEPVVVAASATPAKRRLRLVPEAWAPSAKVLSDLADLGFVSGEIERELSTFRDHEFRDPKSDFDRAFRTWMKRSRIFRTGQPHERPHTDDKFARRQANYAASDAGFDAIAGRSWKP